MALSLSRRRTPATSIHAPLAPHARQIVSNMLVQMDGTVLAGVRPAGVRWDYTTMDDKRQLLNAIQDGWANMLGRTVHERVTSSPHPVVSWARRLDQRTPAPLPDVHTCNRASFTAQQLEDGDCGCETWGRHLLRMQRRITSGAMNNKVTFRYFSVGEIDPDLDFRHHVLALIRHQITPPEQVKTILTEARKVSDLTSGPGWRTRAMTQREQLWLRQRSLALSVPAQDLSAYGDTGLTSSDIESIGDATRWDEEPWDRCVKVTAWRGGKKITRAVQVLTCARLEDMRYPENGLEGWQAFLDRAVDPSGRPVVGEWSINGRLYTGAELAEQARLDLLHALNTDKAYKQFGEIPPGVVSQGIGRAKQIKDEVDNGQDRDSGRFVGTLNIAVYGEDIYDEHGRLIQSAVENVEERGEAVVALFRRNEMKMPFTVPNAQWAKLAEFVPGEPFDTKGYQRQLPLDYLAAGLPTISVDIGDHSGPYLGKTLGAAPTPVQHDTQYATEGQGALGRQQNLWLWLATLGGGKSVGLSSVAYNAARRGFKVVVRDPSGPMIGLTEMLELAPYSFGFNLLSGEDGILNPPSLIRDPSLHEFNFDEEKWRRAMLRAQGERRTLTVDLARRTLDYDLYEDAETTALLRDASRMITWTADRTIWDLIAALPTTKGRSTPANRLAAALTDSSSLPGLSLLFAPRNQGGDFITVEHADKSFIVIAAPGIKRAADDVPRMDWSADERSADAILTGSNLYATKILYGKPMNEPAVAIFDEAEDMTDNASGRASLARLGRDHSKWNISVHAGLKYLHKDMLGGGVRNFIAGAWVGRMATIEPAEAVLDVLSIQDKHHARSLLQLSTTMPGQFVHLDVDRRVGSMQVDVDYFPRLREQVLTNPGNPQHADLWKIEDVIG